MNVPLLGLYDHHRDGVGVCYSSRLRPVVNMRPHYHLPLIRAAHQFPADLHLVDWLAEKGFEVDVITDEDLHEEGERLLRRYRVVLTGSHPEYWTAPMLDALESWLEDAGGRLMYLGGNGFYWVTSVDPTGRLVVLEAAPAPRRFRRRACTRTSREKFRASSRRSRWQARSPCSKRRFRRSSRRLAVAPVGQRLAPCRWHRLRRRSIGSSHRRPRARH